MFRPGISRPTGLRSGSVSHPLAASQLERQRESLRAGLAFEGIEQFATLLRSAGEIGRKSEFLLQEIGREVNTIGSKANDLLISRAVIELKNELERIREQIANVE